MPSRNVIKIDVSDSYYHIYARGHGRQVILREEDDYLNPDDWRAYPYSSIHAYYGIGRPEWLQSERTVDLFASLPHYADFLDDHEGYKESLLDVGQDMANTIL